MAELCNIVYRHVLSAGPQHQKRLHREKEKFLCQLKQKQIVFNVTYDFLIIVKNKEMEAW